MDVQQPLGVLSVDAAKLCEHSHDLQEQEPAGQPEESLGCGLTFAQVWECQSQDSSAQPRDKVWLNPLRFSFSLRPRRAEQLGDCRCGAVLPARALCLGLESLHTEAQALQRPSVPTHSGEIRTLGVRLSRCGGKACGLQSPPGTTWDIVSETHLVPQFPHNASWL